MNSVCLKIAPKTPYTEEEVQFGFINFETNEEASKAYFEGKKNEKILNLIHPKHNKGIDFLFFA